MCVRAQLCPTLATPWTVACQAPLSMEFYKTEYWSAEPFLLQGIFPTQGLNLGLLHGKWILYHLSHWTSNLKTAQFSSVLSDSLGPHGQQHTRPPCPSPTPGVSSNSCPLSQ